MQARDVMTSAVVSVRPDVPIQQIARFLRDKGISAVPVVDESGAPIGMVSEGDLIGRDESAREARRDWWLTLLADDGTELSPDFLANLQRTTTWAREVMSAPVVTVEENADLRDIARRLIEHRV